MCIIAAKKRGVHLPSKAVLETMFMCNPHGAGIAWLDDSGKVRIRKGLMTFEEFSTALDAVTASCDPVETPMILHFRITTHGGTAPENTHPYPITDSIKRLKALNITTPVAVAHNGIIPITPRAKDVSDTQEWIASVLSPLSRALPKWYKNPDALTLVRNTLQSKLAVLDSKGDITLVGDFNEDNGMLYSNYSWMGWGTYGYGGRMSYSAWYEDDPDPKTKTVTETAPKNTSTVKSKKKSKKKKAKESSKIIRMRQLPLMFLCADDPGAYVKDYVTGTMYEGEDFAVDVDGNVYSYDETFDMWSLEPELLAYTTEGMALPFYEELASLEYILAPDALTC